MCIRQQLSGNSTNKILYHSIAENDYNKFMLTAK